MAMNDAGTADALLAKFRGSTNHFKRPLLVELPAELDLSLDLEDDLTVRLPAAALQLIGLWPGQPLVVDVHPLSLRLDSIENAGKPNSSPEDLPLARVDSEGRIHLPFEPPRLKGRQVLLQLRRLGSRREIHLLADSR